MEGVEICYDGVQPLGYYMIDRLRELLTMTRPTALRCACHALIWALLIGLVLGPLGIVDPARSVMPASAQALPPVVGQVVGPDVCTGDELISFAPAAPEVGAELIVAVTSATRHRGVLLTSSERPNPVREYEGQLGWVWLWAVTPIFTGPHKFQFYVDTTNFCLEQTIEVAPSTIPGLAGAVASPSPLPGTTSGSGTTSVVPPFDNDNSGDDDNDNSSNGNSSNGNSFNENSFNDNFEVFEPKRPNISAVACNNSGSDFREMHIAGNNFGPNQVIVGGSVFMTIDPDDEEPSAVSPGVLKWQNREIVVLVLKSVLTDENPQRVFVVDLGGFDSASLPGSCTDD